MKAHTQKSPGIKNQATPRALVNTQGGNRSTFQFVDNRREAIQMRELQGIASQQAPAQRKTNNTGLPDNLKAGIENLSGYSMNDVKVHSNSDKPARLNAHAYAQGTDIYLGPGQQKHLSHEAWHVVQQKQGRVKPTLQVNEHVNINDDKRLEKEADTMGAKAFQIADNRPEAVVQGKLKAIADHYSPQQAVQKKANMASSRVVQRNEVSAKVLSEMVAPQVGRQDVKVATEIQDALEDIYTNTMRIGSMEYLDSANYNTAVCLGGIILPPLRGITDVNKLVEICEFVNLGKGSVNRGIYELLNSDLKKKIMLNTLSTMAGAGQLEYLNESNFAGKTGSEWKIVIEVHYYRERPTTSNVFHKDTLGNTLFVNLNYLNKEKIVGPEYVVNPMENEQHMKALTENLPEEFLTDRRSVMDRVKEPEVIDVVEVPEYGYVAFVDEMISHSSPTTEHRKVKGSDIHKYLRERDSDKYNTYKAAYVKWRKQWFGFWDYESYLPDGGGFDGEDWLYVFQSIEDGKTKYTRDEIRSIEPEKRVLSDREIERLLHVAEHNFFGKVSIPKVKEKINVTRDDRPLKRKMSKLLKENNATARKKESGGRRSFFRTWVRAEMVEAEVVKPDWKWNQTM